MWAEGVVGVLFPVKPSHDNLCFASQSFREETKRRLDKTHVGVGVLGWVTFLSRCLCPLNTINSRSNFGCISIYLQQISSSGPSQVLLKKSAVKAIPSSKTIKICNTISGAGSLVDLGRVVQNTIKLTQGYCKFLTCFYSFAESFAINILFPSIFPDTKIKPHKTLYLIYAFIQEKSKPSLIFNPGLALIPFRTTGPWISKLFRSAPEEGLCCKPKYVKIYFSCLSHFIFCQFRLRISLPSIFCFPPSLENPCEAS